MIGIVEKGKENKGQVLIGYHKIKFLQFMNLWKTLPEKEKCENAKLNLRFSQYTKTCCKKPKDLFYGYRACLVPAWNRNRKTG